jgi:coenzyme F420 hydrogenase subunit beta
LKIKQSMKSLINSSIQNIVNSGLCTGCGACAGICPHGAITIDYPESYKPEIHKSKCKSCDSCYHVCPGKGWPVVSWTRKLCKDSGIDMNDEFGPFKKAFLGRSTDKEILSSVSSGGVATGLLLYLLKTKQVDAVAIVGLENGYPVSKITDNPEEVLSCAGSKYSPVPVMQHIISKLNNNPCRLAMTIIPCHLAALHRALEINKSLAGSEIFTIGLFCGDLKDYESVYRIADSLNVNYPQEAKFIGWRCGNWPGNARFELNNGAFADKPLHPCLDISIPYYSLQRCLMCPSRENWLADLTLADNHAGQTTDTVIVARSIKGYESLRGAEKNNFIRLNEINMEQMDKIVTRTKFIPALSYMRLRKYRKQSVPEYDYDDNGILSGKKWILRYLYSLKYRMFILVRRKRILSFLINHKVIMSKLGKFLNEFPYSIPGAKRLQIFIKKNR